MSKIIMSCAVTGSIHPPSMSPYLPITGGLIAVQAIAAAEASAAILNLRSSHRATVQRPRALAFSGGGKGLRCGGRHVHGRGSAVMKLAQRLVAPVKAAPEMCSLNKGTMNFALYPVVGRIEEWLHNWDRPFLESTDDMVCKNTPHDIADVLHEMGTLGGARFEFDCYDIGHLTMLRHFVDRGAVTGPLYIQFVVGVPGGMAAEPDTLVRLKRTADRLFADDYQFSVLAAVLAVVLSARRAQVPMATMAVARGGHVRLRLEDNLSIGKGVRGQSNAEQVRPIRGIVEGLGREVATPGGVRSMPGLKDSGAVTF
jgi:uncharacterized protein (DUF849 family)